MPDESEQGRSGEQQPRTLQEFVALHRDELDRLAAEGGVELQIRPSAASLDRIAGSIGIGGAVGSAAAYDRGYDRTLPGYDKWYDRDRSLADLGSTVTNPAIDPGVVRPVETRNLTAAEIERIRQAGR